MLGLGDSRRPSHPAGPGWEDTRVPREGKAVKAHMDLSQRVDSECESWSFLPVRFPATTNRKAGDTFVNRASA